MAIRKIMTEQAARSLARIPNHFEAWFDEDDGSWVFHHRGEHCVAVYASGKIALLMEDPAVSEPS